MIERLRVQILTGTTGAFSSPELTLCADTSAVSIPSLVTTVADKKKTSHSAKSTGGRLHLSMHTLLTQQSQSGLTMPLSRHSVGTYLETSSHATCQGTFDHSHLSSVSRCGRNMA